MAWSGATAFLGIWIGILMCYKPSYATGKGSKYNFCVSLPELYYANVAGRISGGVDLFQVSDQTLCSQRTYVDLHYRQMDGKCNHRLDYGSTFKSVKRYIRAHYQDKYSHNAPRIYSVLGGLLPSPREVSRTIHPDKPKTDGFTMWVLQLGQFIDHDFTSFPVPTDSNSSIKCCGPHSPELNDVCLPIPIPFDDDSFQHCMEFVRSEPLHDEDGNLVLPREQMNVLTSFLDLSAVYGSDEKTLRRLRAKDGRGALLKTRLVYGKERLPMDDEDIEGRCLVSHRADSYCQLAGDLRVNEHPGLASSHLVFHLYHNYVVRKLVTEILRKRGERPNPYKVESYIINDPDNIEEKIFQEAKKISGGIFQKIVYCDWLPHIIGPDLVRKFQLGCDRRSRYNPYVDPRISNAFSTAAYRFGHTLIPNKIEMDHKKVDLKDQFMIPDGTLNYFESIISGMCEKGSQEGFDRFISKSVSKHLFEPVKGKEGALDLISLNIQRGRDHGIPAYYYWRKYYGLKTYTSFSDFEGIEYEMESAYKHLLDVDLFTGGITEKPVRGGMVGETFGHIMANQFADLKFGDAHFFLSKEVPQGFTSDQINCILQINLANILCKVGNLDAIQPDVFLAHSPGNEERPCSSFPELDVVPWMRYFY